MEAIHVIKKPVVTEKGTWGMNEQNRYVFQVDTRATKTDILRAHRNDPSDKYWALCFGLRAPEELYDLSADPDCLRNLAADPAAAATRAALSARMTAELTAQGDPRMSGQGDVFDHYEYANRGDAHFYDRFLRGEKMRAGWINPDDIDPTAAGNPAGCASPR